MTSRPRTRSRKTAIAVQEESLLLRWLKERHITEVECLVPDITGNARGKIIPADKFSHDYGTRLPEGIFATTVTGDYPDDYYELTSPADADMILRPDPDTVRMVPWATDPTAQIIHDCYTKNGQPHELAPRNVLRRVLAAYEELGLKPVVAPEVEFFLVQKNTDPDFPLLPPAGRSGRPETARQSYSIDAVNEFDPILDLMYDYCDAMKLDVDTLIHESGAAQLEVNFTHSDAMSLADQVFLFKRTMREAALRHGIYATFLAKPMETEPGSAMHIHQSLVRIVDGRNVFAGHAEGEYSETFDNYLAGLQNIPVMYYEAAKVDGISEFAQFRYITLPLLMPAIQSAVVLNLVGGFKLFDVIMALTSGGPGYASHSLSTLVHRTYFGSENAGYASAIGIIAFLLILVVSSVVTSYFTKKEAEL